MDTTPFDLIVIEPADESAGEPTDVPIAAPTFRQRRRRRSSVLLASLAVAAVAIAVGMMPTDRQTGVPSVTTASDTLPVAEATPDRSALLDGHAFAQAVEDAVAIADRVPSALLDGRAFERAVEDAVESAIG